MIKITKARAMWQEEKGFTLNRYDTGKQYIFVHFISNATVLINGKTVSIKPGGCILYGMHSHQQILSPDCKLVHDWFHITGNIKPILQKYNINVNTIFYFENGEKITEVVQEMEIESLQCNAYKDEMCLLLFEKIIILLSRLSVESNYNMSKISPDMIKLRTHIHMNYSIDWNVKLMSEKANMSISRFYSNYKKAFGISPQKDLQNIRLEHAVTLLKSNNYSVEKVSEMVGYKSTYHFIRQFKNVFGKSPKRYCTYK